ncbi:hypothetical protein OKB67_003088 [Klebsiella oxytoca]|uniref:hypothetical protein n=1 Tax=Klebsiella sp. HMSC09D12 TaxID=1581146 RepID=UPI000983709B|nr:hypothetical protein [Klebsiella sp. HMSC09D12]
MYPPPDRARRAQSAHNTTDTPTISKTDRRSSGALAAPRPDKINLSRTKSALHRTRLHILDRKKFSVGIFYKRHRQPAPRLGRCRWPQTEKSEKNFSIFQLKGSAEDSRKKITIRKKEEFLILCEWEGSFAFEGF